MFFATLQLSPSSALHPRYLLRFGVLLCQDVTKRSSQFESLLNGSRDIANTDNCCRSYTPCIGRVANPATAAC